MPSAFASIPGPSEFSRIANFFVFRDRPTDFLLGLARDHGLMVRFGLGPMTAVLVAEPSLVEQILLSDSHCYGPAQGREDMKLLLGEGLLTSVGEAWKRSRKLMAPPLRKRRIDSYAKTMVERTEAYVTRLPEVGTRDVGADMMSLTLRIVIDTLFGVDTGPDVERVGHHLESAIHFFERRIRGWLRFVPQWWPTRARARFLEDRKAMNRIVYGLIEAGRQDPEGGDDLLRRLLQARYDDGSPLSEEELRDQVITMFLAGHETTALALAYALHLVAAHPEVQDRLHAELDAILGSRSATADDLASLSFTRAIFQEALRLCPPAWAASRKVLEDTELGGYRLPKGTLLFYSPFVTHRQAQFFEGPDAFRPERWLDGLEQRLPRMAYLPFGGGPRICIGNHFALMEGGLVLATLMQGLRFRDPQSTLRFSPSVTLRPAHPVKLTFRRRCPTHLEHRQDEAYRDNEDDLTAGANKERIPTAQEGIARHRHRDEDEHGEE
ncbi:MAG: cytochrome P450 [Myxococcota bacterium]